MNQQPTQPQESMSPQQPAVARWLWIVLIIVILIAGGFFAWQYLGKTKTKTTTTPATTTTTPTTPVSTADWKTYTDIESNYSIKYPTTFQLKEDKPSSKLFSGTDGSFWVNIENNIKKLDSAGIKDDYYQNDDYGYQYQDSFVTIAGINSYKQGRYDLGVIEKYYIPKNDKIYSIAFEFNFDTPNQTLKDTQVNLISQILSTFQFTP